jgi:aspartyl-tRNA(Asn)/glutamyl-tRNA(Gln) amidotransferase subunit A
MTDLAGLTLTAASELLTAREVTSVELTEAVLGRIAATEPDVHAYVRVIQSARRTAQAADELRRSGEPVGPLLGIPVAVKDLFNTIDAPTEAGSRVREGFKTDTDAAAVSKLREAGAIIIGKTVTHEFAYGMNLPPTRNPWQLDSYPGGSSAGSAVAVAVGSAFAALGTDTAGSVRTPAAVNGVVGFKPTYGRISRYGVVPCSPSLDHVGILARSVNDCVTMLHAVAGPDPRDPASLSEPVGTAQRWSEGSLSGLRLGIERPYFFDSAGVQPGVRSAVDDATVELERLGAELIQVSIPELDWMTAVGSTLMAVDYSAWHRQLLRDHGREYDTGTRRMLVLGELIPGVAYANAQRARRRLCNAVRETFQSCRLDALVAPTIPVIAPRLTTTTRPGDTADLSGLVHHGYPANIVGSPALSVPCGFAEGMPVGMQIMGRPLDELTVLRIGAAYEAATSWHLRKPMQTENGHECR